MREVRAERTNWRDEKLSRRHREWGWDCPAVDIDLLMVEYDRGRAAAIVEYKNEHAKKQTMKKMSANYKALIDLGNRADVPVFTCRYSDDLTQYRVTPLNKAALFFARNQGFFTETQKQAIMSEETWVTFLYAIRGRAVPQKVLDTIRRTDFI